MPRQLVAFKYTASASVIILLLFLRGSQVGGGSHLRQTHSVLAGINKLQELEAAGASAAWDAVVGRVAPDALRKDEDEVTAQIDSLAFTIEKQLGIPNAGRLIGRLGQLHALMRSTENRALSLLPGDRVSAHALLNTDQYNGVRREWHATTELLRQAVGVRRDAELASLHSWYNRLISLSLLLATLFVAVAAYGEYTTQRLHVADKRNADSARVQQSLLAALGEGVLGMNAHGITIFANPIACKLLGYTEQELVGKHQHTLIHYKHVDGTPYSVNDCPSSKTLCDGNTHRADNECFWTKSGDCLFINLVSTPIVEDGKVIRSVQVFRDVTEKRRVENALRESEKAYQDLFDRIPIGIFRSTPDGRILQGNAALVNILGFDNLPALQAIGTAGLYVNPEDRRVWTEAVAKGENAAVFEARIRRADGDIIWLRSSVRAVRDEAGAVKHFDGAVEDITRQRQTDSALQETVATTNAILEGATDAFVAIDAGGHIIQWNQAATCTFGWSAEEILGQTLSETIIPFQHRSAHERGMARVLEPGFDGVINRRLEMSALHRDGREFPVEFTITAVKGKSVIFTSFMRDITERVKLAEHIRQNQKLEALGGLAGGIAHDFNNLLTVIAISAEWLQEMTPEEGQADARQIIETTKKAQGLTQQLLAYSRKQFLQATPTNLNGIVGSIDKMLRRLIEGNVEIVTLLDPSLGIVNVDRGQIEQVVTNLVLNSRDALPNGGRIIIETRNVEVLIDDPIFQHVPPGKYALLSVSDNGTGMSPEVQRRAFEPFFTTKAVGQGTGLGLAMVHGIVKQSGGEIILTSDSGFGTTIRMLFPELEGEFGESAAAVSTENPTGTERLLIVEDQTAVRQAARRVLDSLGYTVYECSNGEEALARIYALNGNIDLVLSDLVMPEMGGRELARRLKLQRPAIKVLFMSGYSSDTASGTTFEPNTVGLLEKPFSRHTIATAVRNALDS